MPIPPIWLQPADTPLDYCPDGEPHEEEAGDQCERCLAPLAEGSLARLILGLRYAHATCAACGHTSLLVKVGAFQRMAPQQRLVLRRSRAFQLPAPPAGDAQA